MNNVYLLCCYLLHYNRIDCPGARSSDPSIDATVLGSDACRSEGRNHFRSGADRYALLTALSPAAKAGGNRGSHCSGDQLELLISTLHTDCHCLLKKSRRMDRNGCFACVSNYRAATPLIGSGRVCRRPIAVVVLATTKDM